MTQPTKALQAADDAYSLSWQCSDGEWDHASRDEFIAFYMAHYQTIRTALEIYDRILKGETKELRREPTEEMSNSTAMTDSPELAFIKAWDAAPAIECNFVIKTSRQGNNNDGPVTKHDAG